MLDARTLSAVSTKALKTDRKAVSTRAAQTESAPSPNPVLNALTEAIASSPLNQGKLWLAKKQAGDYDEEKITKIVNKAIKTGGVTMFSFSTCPFCVKAKAALDEASIPFDVIEVDQVDDGLAIRAVLGEMTSRTSMPSIWIGGEYIGGCNDGSPGLMPLIKNEELEATIDKKCSPTFKIKRALKL